MILQANNVTKNFGGLTAVNNVNLTLNKNELIGLIGPNGAGKTTLFNLLTGVYQLSEGTIVFDGSNGIKNIQNKKPYTIANMGITRTFQNIRLFKDLTVLDNVKIAMHQKADYGFLSSILRLPKFYQKEELVHNLSMSLLKEVNLNNKAEVIASNLPYGEQRKLEIARALATNPKLLFLDEPAAGMNPQETSELTTLIKMIKDKFNLTILLIEHDMSLVMSLCERIYVLDYGSIIAEGKPEEIRNNKAVIKAYLGGE
ncbi:MAG: ABC transporter ATP-binding protein [Erysipelotrichaceae bacterium]